MVTKSESVNQDTSATERVAVIAIHGVGEHEPGETSAELSRQLLSVCGAKYRHSQSCTLALEVNTEGLGLSQTSSQSLGPWSRFKRGFGSGFLNRQVTGAKDGILPVDQRFTSSLLLDGNSYRSAYSTTVHSLKRIENGQATMVDVHELHWSDLSHGGVKGGLKIFDQFTQLLLHVASLGRTTLASLLSEPSAVGIDSQRGWRALYQLSALGYWLLAMPILQGNLIFLLIALLLLPTFVPATGLETWVAGGYGLAMAFLVGHFSSKHLGKEATPHRQKSIFLKVPLTKLPSMASALCGTAVTSLIVSCWSWMESSAIVWAFFLVVSGAVGLGWYLMDRYDQIRPGALTLWWILVALTSVVGVLVLLYYRDKLDYLNLLGHVAESIYIFLLAIWILLFVVNTLLVLGISGAVIFGRFSADKKRAMYTALIAASVPAPLLLAVILSLWAAAYQIFGNLIPETCFTPWFKDLLFPNVHTAKEFLHSLVESSGSPAVVPYLTVMAVAATLVVGGLMPSIKAELVRPAFDQMATGGEPSHKLGNWLDGGFMSIVLASFIAGVGFFILLPLGVISQALQWKFFDNPADWIAAVGKWVGGTGVGFLAASQLFAKTFSGFFGKLRIVIDAALDVDNWLRERPRGNTPRLHIFSRFNSLLRYLERGNYDRIVIVAHSQGTVVAADFFRFLKHQLPERHNRLPPVFFISAGCPLRQLYAWRFPFLYAWVNRPQGNPVEPIGPDPEECGISHWVNIFGSGDYVGRYLWAKDDAIDRWTPGVIQQSPTATKSEFCVGPQAHTHYFDIDSQTVGLEIDKAIRGAIRPILDVHSTSIRTEPL